MGFSGFVALDFPGILAFARETGADDAAREMLADILPRIEGFVLRAVNGDRDAD